MAYQSSYSRVGLQRRRENFKLEDVQLLELLQIYKEQTDTKTGFVCRHQIRIAE